MITPSFVRNMQKDTSKRYLGKNIQTLFATHKKKQTDFMTEHHTSQIFFQHQ